MKFNIGDKVRVNLPISSYHAQECSVTSNLYPSPKHISGDGVISAADIYFVDIPPSCGTKIGFLPEHLILLYDGHDTCSWENSAWRPTELVVNEH